MEKQGDLTVARLQGDARGNVLTEALKKDDHIGPFVPRVLPDGTVEGIPSKDNGLDVEGLAVSGNRVFLGLRGPVLRGWTVVIELQVTDGSSGVFMLDVLGSSGVKFRRHFLQLEGLGVRDLVIHGKDVFVLAGPTMDLDGPVFIYRWRNALEQGADSLTFLKDLKGWSRCHLASARTMLKVSPWCPVMPLRGWCVMTRRTRPASRGSTKTEFVRTSSA